jgi:hypothetical protein
MEKEHKFVEIGGIKWATCNVGAEKPTDPGLYFVWGETKGHTAENVCQGVHRFGWGNYKFGNQNCLSKYNEIDYKNSLGLEDDPVYTSWGGRWRTPTTEEFQTLGRAVNTKWTNAYQGSGVSGLICTDKTDSSKVLFFPAVGRCYCESVYHADGGGYYWSSSVVGSRLQSAHSLYFDCGGNYWRDRFDRLYGFPVRGVIG